MRLAIMIIHLFNYFMKKFLKKFKWFVPLVVVVASAITGIDLTPVQKAVEETVNDSTTVRQSTDELCDSIVNDSVCYTPNSDCYAK